MKCINKEWESPLNDNIIQIKNWLRSPVALRGLDRQIQDLSNKLDELVDSKEQSVSDLEDLLQWAINNKVAIHDLRLQSSLEQFVETVSLDDDPLKVTSFDTIVTLVEALDEVIIENTVSLTQKRLEALRLKWQLISETK